MSTIHIIEADLQFLTKKVYAQRMMHNAKGKQLITDEQYGGRKNRQSLSLVINKLLFYNLVHQTVSKAAFMDDDARACYDRIIPHIATVEARKWGVSHKAANMTKDIISSQHF